MQSTPRRWLESRRALAGGESTHSQVQERYFSVDKSLQAVQDQIGFLNLETNTLQEARNALDVLRGAQENLKRYETVSAALWRVVSPKARDAYQSAQEEAYEAGRHVDRFGVATNAEWERRHAGLQQQEKRRPELERKAQGLTAARSVLGQALRGFERQTQAREREERSRLEARAREWEERARAQERRTRDGYDRGRPARPVRRKPPRSPGSQGESERGRHILDGRGEGRTISRAGRPGEPRCLRAVKGLNLKRDSMFLP